MGWSDCFKPASFDECSLRTVLDFVDYPTLPGTPEKEEGLWGLENEAKLLIVLAVAFGLFKVVR